MMTAHPRFDFPNFTRTVEEVFEAARFSLAEQPPLPKLSDPATESVAGPVDEPLVPIVHRRIRVLSNYFHAGWERATPAMLLRSAAMQRLSRVADSLPTRFGLAVFDAWRPLELQAELYEAAYGHPGLPPGYVSEPNPDPATPPPHLTGGTVDLTLTLDGTPLAPGAGFDDFTERARSDALEKQPGADREVRRMLYWAMRRQGFVLLDCEWWHFEYGTRRWAAITGEKALYGPATGTVPGTPYGEVARLRPDGPPN